MNRARWTLAAAAAVLVAASGAARAEERSVTDVHYGRADGDVGLVFGAGTTIAPRGPRAAIDLRFRWADTIGVYAGYEDALGSTTDPKRLLGGGLELRPLYLLRSRSGRELGRARLDLMIDSLGFELGAFFSQPRGAQLGSKPGLQVGLGVEIPVFAHATGIWLGVHGGVRWSDTALAGDEIRGPADRSAYLTISLAWHQVIGGGSKTR
jgi:hypothetical protein